jgi:hypothetical protein
MRVAVTRSPGDQCELTRLALDPMVAGRMAVTTVAKVWRGSASEFRRPVGHSCG